MWIAHSKMLVTFSNSALTFIMGLISCSIETDISSMDILETDHKITPHNRAISIYCDTVRRPLLAVPK